MRPAGRDVLTGKKDESTNLGQFTALDASVGKIVWSVKEPFSVWSGALTTASDLVFYGTLEGYLKVRDAKTGKQLYKFKTPSGIVGNVNTWKYQGKQYIGVLSGIGGWAGMGIATDACTKDSEHGALGSCPAYGGLNKWTNSGGVFTVFALSD